MSSYVVDRLTRLWIVLFPAFALSLIIGIYTNAVDPGKVSYAVDNEYSVASFLGNLLGLQDMAVPRFGGNFPLWSLANEIWYYVLFPLLVVSFAGRSTFSRVAAAAGCLLVAMSLSGPIMLYFPIWLLGVAFSRVEITASTAQRWAVVCVLAVVAIYFRLKGSNDKLNDESIVQDLIFSLPVLLLLSSLQVRADPIRVTARIARKIGTVLAGFSFTLYVIHVPFLILLRNMYPPLRDGRLSPHHLADLGTYLVMFSAILVLSYLFHLPFEAQTHVVRSYIKRKIMGTGQRRSAHTDRAF